MTANLPVFGPTEVQGDEGVEPDVIVRVAYALSREQLVTALGLGFAQIAPDRDPAGLVVDEIRAEVEGFLAAAGIIETDQVMERDRHRAFPPQQQAVMELLAAAVDRAYPTALAPRPPVPGPRYGDGTVTLETLDHGTITVPEPEWCRGHDDYRPVHRADITHNGVEVALRIETELGPAEALGVWISQAPYGELQPEPVPVAAVDIDDGLSLDPEGLRAVARELLSHAGRLYRIADELAVLREAAS